MHFHFHQKEIPSMLSQASVTSVPVPKLFMDIPTAARMAGFSIRHFRRIIEEDGIPIIQIGRKFFILGREFASWEARKGPKVS